MTNTQAVRPSGWFYGLGTLVILIGMGVFGYNLFHGLVHMTDGLTQVVVPGEKDLTLKANLNYTIFVEQQSGVDGKVYATQTDLDGWTCQLTSQTSGKKIGMQRPGGSTTYNIGSRSGRSVLEFRSEEAGPYHFACAYPEASEGEQVLLAVGSGVREAIFGMVFKGLAGLFGGGILGGVVLAVVFVMRDRAKRRLAQSAPLPVPSRVDPRC